MLVSVIATFYNVSKYANDCVKSLLLQSFQNYEVILVDDGSTDSTPQILDEYVSMPNVQVFHKKNGGAGDARNFGFSKASGDYIAFVDGDDFISPYYVECLYNAVVATDCYMVAADHLIVNEDMTLDRLEWPQYGDVRRLDNSEAVEMLLYNSLAEGPWAKLIDRSLFESALFPAGRYYEDVAWAGKCFVEAGDIAILDTPIYAYRMREGSVVHKSEVAIKQAEDFLWAINELVEPIACAFPDRYYALAYRYSLEYARLHALLDDIVDDSQRAAELDEFALGEINELIHIVLNDKKAPVSGKMRFFLLSRSPKLHDDLLLFYERFFKGLN